MNLFLDMTKFHLGELLHGLKIYADLMEWQMKTIQREQKERLGKDWEDFESVFTEGLPTNLRYSVIVALIANIEWSLNYAVGLLKKRGIKLPKKPKGMSENAHKIQFLKTQGSGQFTHPFEEKFLALVTLRNAIVHNAGKPERLVVAIEPFDIYLFDEKVEAAAKTLEPAVLLDTSHMQIKEGFVSIWVQEAHDWLSAFYDFLKLSVGLTMPMAP
jgi:hypothetical protein